jgi:hypothetical protein
MIAQQISMLYKGEYKEIDNDVVYVPNSQYFIDKIDLIHIYTHGM